MSDENIKIQPDDAEEKVGQSSQEATGEEIQNVTAEEWTKKSDEEKLALVNNALKMRGESTRKYMEASELTKNFELEKARAQWLQEQNEQMQNSITELLGKQPATGGSATAQPPKYDPYNPEQWAKDYQSWVDSQRGEDRKRVEELESKIENISTEFDVKLRTQQLNSYLDKVLPTIGPDVRKQDVQGWFGANPKIAPLIEDGSIDKAIKEEQARIDKIKEGARKEYLEKKEKDAQKAQLKPGSPLSTQTPDIEKLTKMSPAEREATIAERVRQLRSEGLI